MSTVKLRGVTVYCVECGCMKKPIGRDGGYAHYCTNDCPGYNTEPYPGSLWPNETSEDFGHPCGTNGTEVVNE